MALETAQRAQRTPLPATLVRQDAWWRAPLVFFALFSAFGIWVTFRAIEDGYYDTQMVTALAAHAPHYLSPLYSPTFYTGVNIGAWALSPALIILPFPLLFRLSCYYYRRSIYRSYLADPLACAVPEPGPLEQSRFRRYMGERGFPLIAQNFHRFAFYAAVVFIAILWKDTVDAFYFTDNGVVHLGLGLGTLVFLTNIILLSGYTFGCHSWRHLVGGAVNCYSCSLANRTRHGLWKKVTFLNESHGRWAMASLISVGLLDVYVWLVATQRIQDIRIF